MVEYFTKQKIRYIETGYIGDFDKLLQNFTDIEDTLDNHSHEIADLLERQTYTISFPVWNSGEAVIVKDRKHPRLKIKEAWVTLGDNWSIDQTVQLFDNNKPLSEPLLFKSTYGAGSMLPIKLIASKDSDYVMFHQPIKIIASSNRRCRIELLVESAESGE